MLAARFAPLPDARATRGMPAARFAPAWPTCHTWHARRTLCPLPGLRATRGMLAARSAPLPDARATRGMLAARAAPCPMHVPRVA